MKTLTEFFGPTLRKAQEEVEKLTGGARPQKSGGGKKIGKKTEQSAAEAGVTDAALAPAADESMVAATPVVSESAASAGDETETPAAETMEAGATEGETPAEATSEAPAETSEATPAEGDSEQSKVAAKLTELYKLEGEKLDWFQKAIELTRTKRGSLKRVIVGQLNEGEKAPAGFTEIDGKVYGIEFFPEAGRPQGQREEREERGGRGGRDKGRGGKGGKGRGKGDRGGRGEGRGEGRGGERSFGGAPRGEGGGAGAGGPGAGRGGDRPRAPRPPRQAPEPYTGPNRIIPKAKTGAAASAPVSNEKVSDPAQDAGSTT